MRSSAREIGASASQLIVTSSTKAIHPATANRTDAVLSMPSPPARSRIRSTMVGADAAAFHRAFAAAGLDEQHIRLSMMIGEDVLCGCGAEATHDLYTACGYFESVVTPEGLEFGSRYERRFGRSAPALNNIGESCYEGLMLLAALARAAGSLDTATIGRTTRGVTYRGPRGEVELCGRHTRQPVYLAQADHLAFDVITELTA